MAHWLAAGAAIAYCVLLLLIAIAYCYCLMLLPIASVLPIVPLPVRRVVPHPPRRYAAQHRLSRNKGEPANRGTTFQT